MLRQKEHATGIRIALLLACGRLVAQYFSVYHCVRCARHLSQASASAWRHGDGAKCVWRARKVRCDGTGRWECLLAGS